jgi:hypothetical protein
MGGLREAHEPESAVQAFARPPSRGAAGAKARARRLPEEPMSASAPEQPPSTPGVRGERPQRPPDDRLPSFLDRLSASSRQEGLELLRLQGCRLL